MWRLRLKRPAGARAGGGAVSRKLSQLDFTDFFLSRS
jgi:hypothetical protein